MKKLFAMLLALCMVLALCACGSSAPAAAPAAPAADSTVNTEGVQASAELYGKAEITERHRHRYEVNNDFREILTENGMKLSGVSPDGRIVEMCEIPAHPWFLATQAHPELKSRPNRPHPLFKGFVGAALKYQNK